MTTSSTALSRAILFLEEFRKIDPEMPMHTALLFLLIAREPGINLKRLSHLTGLGKSVVSRNITLLSEEYGKGLVYYREDPVDRRNKMLFVTAAGERVTQTLAGLVGEA